MLRLYRQGLCTHDRADREEDAVYRLRSTVGIGQLDLFSYKLLIEIRGNLLIVERAPSSEIFRFHLPSRCCFFVAPSPQDSRNHATPGQLFLQP